MLKRRAALRVDKPAEINLMTRQRELCPNLVFDDLKRSGVSG